MKLSFLGTGTSQGVPVINCSCEVCSSPDIKDKRLRTSSVIRINEKNILIDTSPDFRFQALRCGLRHIDAIIITHEHNDHTAGLDDIRPFNFSQNEAMQIYALPRVVENLKQRFPYIFEENPYPGAPQVDLHPIHDSKISIAGEQVEIIEVIHGSLPIIGVKIQKLAYITDASYIDEINFEKLKNLEVLVLNALRKTSHHSHYSLDEALDLINALNVKKAYLTHISHRMGLHNDVNNQLPKEVTLAFDELEVEL